MANEIRIGLGVTGAMQAARELDKVGDAADGTGRDLDGLSKDASELDKAMAALEDKLVAVKLALAADPGDKGLRKELRGLQRESNFLNKLKKDVSGPEAKSIGLDVGKHMGVGIGEALGALPSQLKGAGIAIGASLAAAAAPAIGSAVGAAIIGGVGLGGIAGGIAAAAQDPRVKAAGEHLGNSLKDEFADIGAPFVDPLITQMGRLEGIGGAFFAKLGDDIAPLADHLDNLTDGVAGFARNLDFSKVVKTAGPLIDIMGEELPEVAEAVTEALNSISEEGEGLAIGLKQTFDLIEGGITVTGDLISTLAMLNNELADASVSAGDLADEFLNSPMAAAQPWFVPLALVMSDAGERADEYTEKVIRAKRGTEDIGDAAKDATKKVQDFSDAISDLFNVNMDVAEATSAYKHGMRELRDELTNGKRTLDENTEAGLNNADAIRDQIQKVEALREAEFKQTGNLKATTAAYEARIEKIRAEAYALGLDKAAVDAIVDAWKRVPKVTETEYRIKTEFFGGGGSGGETHPLERRASGGPVMAGKSYIVNENGVEILKAGENGYVMNTAQSAAMMSGASGGAAMGGAQEVRIVLDIRADDEEQARRIRKQVEVLGGGNVQVAYGRN